MAPRPALSQAVALTALLLAASCRSGANAPTEPDPFAPPPPGPHFRVSPVPVGTIARITPIGYNNNIIPTPHTYWLTCDIDVVLQSTRPCHRERQPIRAPGSGVVVGINPAVDGFLRIEGPKGLRWTFGHVTPEPGLNLGSAVTAGQTIARMTHDHGFDFGLVNYGVARSFARRERWIQEYLFGEHPIEQFPEPLRSELISRSQSLSRPLGHLDFDTPGTLAGAWFLQGTPVSTSLNLGNAHTHQWFGRWTEREETRVASLGHPWPGLQNRTLAADPGAPSWETITPASGRVAIRLWVVDRNARPDPGSASGTVLVEMLSPVLLRLEWFPHHNPVSGFTAAAMIYER